LCKIFATILNDACKLVGMRLIEASIRIRRRGCAAEGQFYTSAIVSPALSPAAKSYLHWPNQQKFGATDGFLLQVNSW
jgi:hypothetical protein